MADTNKRLMPSRFRRIWDIIQYIADHPGASRLDLAVHFSLSERQAQADLNIIRHDIGLPLARVSGYCFMDGDHRGTATGLTLPDVLRLARIMQRSPKAPNLAEREAVNALQGKLALLAPIHLRALAALILSPNSPPLATTVAEAILDQQWLKLTFRWQAPYATPYVVLRPELMLPYLNSWYVLGESHGHGEARDRMLSMTHVTDIEAVTVENDAERPYRVVRRAS